MDLLRPTLWAASLFIILAASSADEWKPRHDLVTRGDLSTLSQPGSPDQVFFPGPANPAQAPAWLENFKSWRDKQKTLLHYDSSQYERSDLEWTQHIFSQVQLLIWDRSFYDPEKREYTVDRFLSETENHLGAIDAVLIWHVYPNLGVDDRNQFDLLRDLPGGIPGLRKMIDQFHQHGVKVFFPVLAWDNGTRDEGAAAANTMSQLLKDIGADGINFDTLENVPRQFRETSNATGHPLALEPQFQPRDESLAWANLSWNDWVTWEGKQYPFIPMVNKDKWLEPRHTVNITDRFTRDKTDSLQHAFFNGQGFATLENLWGFWYSDTLHDAEAILRCTRIERAMADYLRSPDWEPHTPMMQPGVFASRFPASKGTLWTIVNRNEFDVTGPQLTVPHLQGMRYYDPWHGTELKPDVANGKATLSLDFESLGFGALLATPQSPDEPPLRDLMSYMAKRSHRPLNSYSKEWKAVPQSIVEITPTVPAATAPAGMIRIPEADFDFDVNGIEIEGGNDPGVDVQYPWEDSPRRSHRHTIHIHSFYIDRTPVTNAAFKQFLDATRYHPADDHNFLRAWKDGTYPEGWAQKPVTWVSIEDARAYATWAGKRLPHEWEWQYAAQGRDVRIYPWGSTWNPPAVPPADTGRNMHLLSDVNAFPNGASPFGILDLVGNVSQWTDEYRDPHTRAAIVRGAAAYQPRGSIWYFPQTYRLDEHEKYLLMSPGRDRTGTIGFRCVVDST
jgi:formylglycine-generating enzyme required for sulfatase activity